MLDFARFLAQREASQEDRDLLLAQQGALADWDNEDDDLWNDAAAVCTAYAALIVASRLTGPGTPDSLAHGPPQTPVGLRVQG